MSHMPGRFKALFISLIACFGILLLHTLFPSIISGPHSFPALRVDNNFVEGIWRLHSTNPAFAGRPLTNLSFSFLHFHLGLPFGWSFVLVSFTLLLLSGLLIYVIAQELSISKKQSLLSVVLFYASFSVLLAFFRSIDTYDEPWQYFLLLLSLLLIIKGRVGWSLPFIFLACLARETTLFVIPGLWLAAQSYIRVNKWLLTMVFLIPCGVYFFIEPSILAHYGVLEASRTYLEQSRFIHWQFNFQNTQFTIETLVSMFAVFWTPIWLTTVHARQGALPPHERRLVIAAAITCVINTPMVLIAARAREARLLALPLIFVWPLLGKYLETLLHNVSVNLNKLSKHTLQIVIRMLLLVVGGLSAWWFSFSVFKPTFTAGFDSGFELYVFVLLFEIISYYLITLATPTSV